MKIYHFNGGRPFSENFFGESLADYIRESGLSIPASSLCNAANIRKGPHGKPYFLDSGLEGIFFSRSHSKGHEVVCFSDGEIGIDCENTAARPGIGERYEDIAKRCFTEDETAYIFGDGGGDGAAGGKPAMAVGEPGAADGEPGTADGEPGAAEGEDREADNDPLMRFFEIWTAKEAYMKYTGKGFSEGFRTFSSLRVPDVNIETGRLREAPYIVYSVCTAKGGM